MFNGRRLRNRREITSGFAKPEHQSQRVRDGDETKSASGRSRVRQNAGLRREFQARVLANAATNAGFIYARFLSVRFFFLGSNRTVRSRDDVKRATIGLRESSAGRIDRRVAAEDAVPVSTQSLTRCR